jgi:hypothetical protein
MRKQHQQETPHQAEEKRKPTPTFLLEVPLRVTASQAKRLRAHLEAARQLYNAILSEGQHLVDVAVGRTNGCVVDANDVGHLR